MLYFLSYPILLVYTVAWHSSHHTALTAIDLNLLKELCDPRIKKRYVYLWSLTRYTEYTMINKNPNHNLGITKSERKNGVTVQ